MDGTAEFTVVRIGTRASLVSSVRDCKNVSKGRELSYCLTLSHDLIERLGGYTYFPNEREGW